MFAWISLKHLRLAATDYTDVCKILDSEKLCVWLCSSLPYILTPILHSPSLFLVLPSSWSLLVSDRHPSGLSHCGLPQVLCATRTARSSFTFLILNWITIRGNPLYQQRHSRPLLSSFVPFANFPPFPPSLTLAGSGLCETPSVFLICASPMNTARWRPLI